MVGDMVQDPTLRAPQRPETPGQFESQYFARRYAPSRLPAYDLFCLERLWRRRVRFLTGVVSQDAGNLRLLDVGCGLGQILSILAKRSPLAVGVDISQFAARTTRSKGFPVALADARSLPYADYTFDGIVAADILSAFDSSGVLAILDECYRVLRTGGRLVVLVLNWYHPRVRKHFFDDYSHRTPFTPVSLRDLAQSVGFRTRTRQELTLTGLPGLGVAAKLGFHSLAFYCAYAYSTLSDRRCHLVLYGSKPGG